MVYIGYDVMVVLLYVGYLLNIMMLCWFQKIGNCLIMLMGGGMIKVGDFSFCLDECLLLDVVVIQLNIDGMGQVFVCYFDYGLDKVLMLNNVEWLDGLNYLDFLCDIGWYFFVNWMLFFELVKFCLDCEQLLSFFEFNYMILQVYDFFEFYCCYDCCLQMGGLD